MTSIEKAEQLLSKFKQDKYLHGVDILDKIGTFTAGSGKQAVMVATAFPGSDHFIQKIHHALNVVGISVEVCLEGPAPNAPRPTSGRYDETEVCGPPHLCVKAMF